MKRSRLLALVGAITLLAFGTLTPVGVGAAMNRPPSVATLRLGMAATQVLQALRRAGETAQITQQRCLADLLAQHQGVVYTNGPGHCIRMISTRYAGGNLLLFFFEALPNRPGVSVLTSIALNYPTAPEAIAAVTNNLGAPTLTDGKTPWTVAMWCFGFACRDMDATLRDPKRGPMLLVHQGAGLTLEDGGAQTRYQRALDAALAQHGVRINDD